MNLGDFLSRKDLLSKPCADSQVTPPSHASFISFDFTTDALTEIRRLDKEGEIEIVPIKVKDLLRRESFA